MRGDPALADAVERFVDDVSRALMGSAARSAEGSDSEIHNGVVMEAQRVAGAFIDSDGLETDDELWAFISAFGPRTGGLLARATPADIRRSGMLSGQREWLSNPSDLFQLLLDLDIRDGSRHGWTYYERAVAIAHTVASLDSHVSRIELEQIERYRGMLLTEISRLDPTRPGQRSAEGPEGSGGEAPLPGIGEVPAEPRPIEDLLAELDALVGMEEVKLEVKLVTNLIRIQNLRRDRGLPVTETSRHLVFVGNPGTGKTTVARLLAGIFHTLGVVDRGHLVETDRAGLVAGFVGQTAARVVEVFDRAEGGVLLIDEAYSLVRGSEQDFGREAIDTIVKEVEDRRDSVVVIVAGYPNEMEAFLDSNPGLRSRFPKTIPFPDYTNRELVQIFELLAARAHYTLSPGALERVQRWIEAQPRAKGFANGRLVRNLLEDAMARHASRVVEIADPTDDQLVLLSPEDIPDAGEGPGHVQGPREP